MQSLRGCRQAVIALDYARRVGPAVEAPVVARIPLQSGRAYLEAARQIAAGPVDVVSLQHEFRDHTAGRMARTCWRCCAPCASRW